MVTSVTGTGISTGVVTTESVVLPIPPRRIAQLVNFSTATYSAATNIIPADNTIPQNTEGTEVMQVTITPKQVGSQLRISVLANYSVSSASDTCTALFRDSVTDAMAVVGWTGSAAQYINNNKLETIYTTTSLSPITFKVRVGPATAVTLYFNGSSGTQKYGGTLASSITIEEYLP